MRTRRVSGVIGVTVLAAALLSSCGDSDDGGGSDKPFAKDSADQIASKAVAATKGADSMRIKGDMRQDGKPVSLDIAVDQEKNCEGTIGTGGAKAEVRHTNGTLYMRGNEQYWKASLKNKPGSEKVISKVADKWVKMPADDASTAGMCDKQGLVASMDENKSERKGMKKGETTSVDGKDAIALTKKGSGGETNTMYVATEGKPYILRVSTKGGDAPNDATFGDYDKPVKPETPAKGETVDLKELAASGQ
ncbi:hypothetical protein DEJ48_08860 [Streptomyces venezuelae]|uniref:Lipoprotein n=1 Tax=Streptomyces venezuelae TaxID=54571 RepID=A0A5P2BSL6_STRVZ|nr:hypothetical protein DEJ48_08860 [Streptomyces venezuelae]